MYDQLIKQSFAEDIGDGDHSTLACIPPEARGKSQLIIKEKGVLAGVEVAQEVFKKFDNELKTTVFIGDGAEVNPGDVAFVTEGKIQSLLQTERLILNVMQRMSGIATVTRQYTKELDGLHTCVLDTRKTTPGLRLLEKEAVRIGGGVNHRIGLYDMIMLKDNHIDFAGGIEKAIKKTHEYLKRTGKNLKIEIEVRNLDELAEVLRVDRSLSAAEARPSATLRERSAVAECSLSEAERRSRSVDRIMFDNFDIPATKKAVEMVGGRYETESSGGITLDTLRAYAECGVDFISVGALTHSVKSLDMSFKAV